jgi:hypothetical protein
MDKFSSERIRQSMRSLPENLHRAIRYWKLPTPCLLSLPDWRRPAESLEPLLSACGEEVPRAIGEGERRVHRSL